MADDGEGQQQQHGWMPQPRIPKFSGDQDWQEFHGEAERVLEAYTFPPKIAVEFLLRSLEGQARKEVLSLATESRDTTEKIPTPLRRSTRSTAGINPNPFHLPTSANRWQ
jgi:hypothetical protein